MRSNTARKGRIKQKRPFFKPKRSNLVAKQHRVERPHKAKTSVPQIKRSIFVSLRGAQRRGNLKVIDVASRGEAREHETTKSPNSDPSRSNTTSALLRKRYFTRAQARVSRAQYLSHDQRSYFTAKPYSLARRATFTAQP